MVKRLLIVFGFALFVAACGPQQATCGDDCRVEFVVQLVGDDIPERYVVEVTGDGQQITAICQDGQLIGQPQAQLNALISTRCTDDSVIFLTDPVAAFSPREVSIHVRTADGEAITRYTPTYEIISTDDPHCAPGCASATAVANLP